LRGYSYQSIVIFSGFITLARTGEIGDILRSRITAGVKVRCVTRAPAFNGSIPADHGRSALQALETIGVAIDLRQDIHEKVVVIDGRIVWFGSLNPLSHSSKTSEIMARVDNAAFASQIAQLLSLRPNAVPDDHGESFAEPENPRCPICGGWTVVRSGKFGRFLAGEACKHWSKSLDHPIGKGKKTTV
jgi:phosphatidylserine/phosphatidylglycerophosphate/cardiolipin synthase-like enzyme